MEVSFSFPTKLSTQPFIDGEFLESAGEALPMINPASEETWCEVALAQIDDVDRAVSGAQRAFEQTRRETVSGKRCSILPNIAKLIRENLEELAQLRMRNIDCYAHTARCECNAFDAAVTDWERVRDFERI